MPHHLLAGDWVELELSTADASPDAGSTSHLYLGYLRSYRGMGLARVECVAGCTCAAGRVDGLWQQRVSLTQIHELKVGGASPPPQFAS
jgi:hypothetical protein